MSHRFATVARLCAFALLGIGVASCAPNLNARGQATGPVRNPFLPPSEAPEVQPTPEVEAPPPRTVATTTTDEGAARVVREFDPLTGVDLIRAESIKVSLSEGANDPLPEQLEVRIEALRGSPTVTVQLEHPIVPRRVFDGCDRVVLRAKGNPLTVLNLKFRIADRGSNESEVATFRLPRSDLQVLLTNDPEPHDACRGTFSISEEQRGVLRVFRDCVDDASACPKPLPEPPRDSRDLTEDQP